MADILKQESLSDTEQAIIIEHMKCPVMQKYLRSLAVGLMLDMAEAIPAIGQSDTDFVRELQGHRGALQAYKQLLSISQEA